MAAPRGEGSPGRELGGYPGAWGALRGPPQALLPCPCPVLASYSLLPPPLTLLAPLVHPPLEAPLGLPAEPGRAKAAAARESTRALKAWLARHPRNPYPSKGEKAMLAVLSSMSLTQVSTWFANARRRLKKENKASWAARGASDGDDSESEGGPGAAPGPCPSPEGGPGPGQGNEPPKPKIWSVAAMLAPSESRCPPRVLEQAQGPDRGQGYACGEGTAPGLSRAGHGHSTRQPPS